MLGLGVVPDGLTNWQIFTPHRDQHATLGVRTWNKPLGCSMVFILALGPGGGGGGGFAAATSTARGGSGGGGSGALATLLIPAFCLPDVLYVKIGAGGLGGNSGATGSAGGTTFVYTASDQPFALFQVGVGAGGAVGTAAAAGSGGFGAASNVNTHYMARSGIYTTFAGLQGGSGGIITGTAGSDASILAANGSPTTGGGGGGSIGTANTPFAGGGTTTTLFPALPGGASAGGAGIGGYNRGMHLDVQTLRRDVFLSSGGSGGGSSTTTGGRGGDGGYGGGGGAGGSGVTGGVGGKGGDGVILIGAF